MKNIKNNKAPVVRGFSKENITRLEDVGLDWRATKKPSFMERLEELKAYKEKHRHCIVKANSGDHMSLGGWCLRVRAAMKKDMNNEAPVVG